VKLPAVCKVGEEKYESRYPGLTFDRALRLRTAILENTVKEYLPDILLVDHSPLGMKGEILSSLKWLKRNRSSSVIVLGLRDIIDDPQKVIALWQKQNVYEVLHNLYDIILIYGTPAVFDSVALYKFSDTVKAKTHYCGYITDWQSERKPPRTVRRTDNKNSKSILVTIGGGDGAGETVIGNFLEALNKYKTDLHFNSVVLTGPFLPPELRHRFKKAARNLPVRIKEFVPSTRNLLIKSDLVISTGGYNTVTDILYYAQKALIIPRMMYRKEQFIRAKKLSDHKLLTFISPDEVTPDLLFNAVTSLLASDDTPLEKARREKTIPLDGAKHIVKCFGELFAKINQTEETLSW